MRGKTKAHLFQSTSPCMSKPIRYAIADDHVLVTDGLRMILDQDSDLECVGTAVDGSKLLALVERNPVDVVLLDINMPVMDGITTCEELKQKFPHIKVLIITMIREVSMIRKSLNHGADGYLLKHEGKEEIIKAIKAVCTGEMYNSKAVTDLVMHSFTSNFNAPPVAIPKLSRREKEVLALIVDEHSTAELADKLFISFNTAASHRKSLMAKLDVKNTAGLVRRALELGLV